MTVARSLFLFVATPLAEIEVDGDDLAGVDEPGDGAA